MFFVRGLALLSIFFQAGSILPAAPSMSLFSSGPGSASRGSTASTLADDLTARSADTPVTERSSISVGSDASPVHGHRDYEPFIGLSGSAAHEPTRVVSPQKRRPAEPAAAYVGKSIETGGATWTPTPRAMSPIKAKAAATAAAVEAPSDVIIHRRRVVLTPSGVKPAEAAEVKVAPAAKVTYASYKFHMNAGCLNKSFEWPVEVGRFESIQKLHVHLLEVCDEWLSDPKNHLFSRKFRRWQTDVMAGMDAPNCLVVFYLIMDKKVIRLDSFKKVTELEAMLRSSGPSANIQIFVNFVWGNFGIPIRLRLERDPATEIKVSLQEECFESHELLLNEISRLTKVWGWRESGQPIKVFNSTVTAGGAGAAAAASRSSRSFSNILSYKLPELQKIADEMWKNTDNYWSVLVEPDLVDD